MKFIMFFLSLAIFCNETAYAQANLEITSGDTLDFVKTSESKYKCNWQNALVTGYNARRTFTIANRNGKSLGSELIITSILPSCGCMTVEKLDYPIRLKRGESISIATSFNDNYITGEMHKSISIHSNASNAPRIFNLMVTNKVVTSGECKPPTKRINEKIKIVNKF